MKIQGKIIVTDVYKSEKTGRYYITAVDLENGSNFKFSIDTNSFVVGKTYEVNTNFKARPDKSGGSYLIMIGGE